MSNFREMAPKWLQNGCSKTSKILKYEHIKLRENMGKNRFREISYSVHKIAKFEYFMKVIINSKSSDHVL